MSVHGFIQKIYISPHNEELSQAIARIVFLLLFDTIFLVNIHVFGARSFSTEGWAFFGAVQLYTFLHFLWVYRSQAPNIARRGAAIVFDTGAVTLGIWLLEWAGMFIYPVYLWIIVGNGMRFGSRYLLATMGLTVVEYGTVLLFHPFWAANQHMGMGLMAIIVILPLFFLVMLKRLQRSNAQLREQLELRKRQQAIMIAQSRNAAMGEMISNIAHQWRQPLNTMALLLQNIEIMHETGRLDARALENSVEKGVRISQMMSKTIDDFRNFFKPNKRKEAFDVTASVEQALGIIEAALKLQNIAVVKELDPSLQGYGFANEFAQVLLNILANAKDVLTERGTESAAVRIASAERGGYAVITIEDNGGGIPETAIGRIFDPYFSTKHEKEGTGIGLYMSKLIVEEHMSGTLEAGNSEQGAIFVITIPSRAAQEDKDE